MRHRVMPYRAPAMTSPKETEPGGETGRPRMVRSMSSGNAKKPRRVGMTGNPS